MAIGDITALEWPTDCELQPSVMASLLSEMEILFDSWVDQLQPIIQVNSPTEPIVAEWVAAWQQQGGEGDIPSNGSFRWSDTSQSEKEYTREYVILDSGGVNPTGTGGEAMPGTVTRIKAAIVEDVVPPVVLSGYEVFQIEFSELVREGHGVISMPITYDNNITPTSSEWLRMSAAIDDVVVSGYASATYGPNLLHAVGKGTIDQSVLGSIKQCYLDFNIGALDITNTKVSVGAIFMVQPPGPGTVIPTIYDLLVLPNVMEHGTPGSFPDDVLLPFMQLKIYH